MPGLPSLALLTMLRSTLAALVGIGALLASPVLSIAALPTAASAQGRCYHIVSFLPPDLMRCQQVGRDQQGRPIWLCC